LEARNVENEVNDLKQEEKIAKLEAKLQSYRLAPVSSASDESVLYPTDNNEMTPMDGRGSSLDENSEDNNSVKLDDSIDNNTKMNLINEQRSSNSDGSSTRAITPSSCRDLSLLGHSLDGLYLVQNVDTNKVETVLCNFGTSRK